MPSIRKRGMLATGIGATLLAGLAGCATLGGNVSGNFSCSAPGGICAPTSAIDDQALTLIEQGATTPTGGENDSRARFIPVRGSQTSATQPARGMRIVLPGRVDRFGRWREPQTVYAEVAMAGGEAGAGGPAAPARLSLAELASGAPALADAPVAGQQTLVAAPSAFNDVVKRAYAEGLRGAMPSRAHETGSIDGVIAALERTGHPQGMGLAISMRAFSSSGTYGRFFEGKASLRIDADLTVFELSDLASREELRSVVLTAIMFLSSQAMRANRSVRKALILDEAWQMLKGGSMAEFVETYARTCRKYGGSLITATQSLNDYYKSDGSVAALENSDWTVMLMQKSETISDFSRLGRFEMNGATEAMLRSLKRNGAEYSDMLIRGPDTEAQGRLVLDPYSATVYSSSPQTFARIEQLVASGLSMAEAIERVACPDGVGWAQYDPGSDVEFREAAE